jgi:hypothetical protein
MKEEILAVLALAGAMMRKGTGAAAIAHRHRLSHRPDNLMLKIRQHVSGDARPIRSSTQSFAIRFGETQKPRASLRCMLSMVLAFSIALDMGEA